MHTQSPVVKDLVLLGGGHAHVAVLKRQGLKPLPDLRITLITRDIHTPYSGMLPGYVAGHYHYDKCHIDLGPLAQFAGATLYRAEVDQLDLENKKVHAPGSPPISYDLLSINTGSRPNSIDVPGVDEFALAAKPINLFIQKWERLIERVRSTTGTFRVVIVGGGAGGVELALCTQHRLQNMLQAAGQDPARLHYTLLERSDRILLMHNDRVRKRFRRIFAERNITIKTATEVTEVNSNRVILQDGESRPADAVIWVTTASAPAWLAEAGLAVDDAGFIQVDTHLQSLSHEGIFAAGDVASLPDPRPKSGVFAVRQGPVLSDNVRAAATGRRLLPYHAQKNFLSLISTGNKYAIASRGNWAYESDTLWQYKNWIDARFMSKFNELPEMEEDDNTTFKAGNACGPPDWKKGRKKR